LTKITDEEKRIVKEQIDQYKKIRKLVQFGKFYRLLSPFEKNESSWMISDEHFDEFILYYFRILNAPNEKRRRIKIKGIDIDKDYRLIGTTEVYGGDELSFNGILLPEMQGDFQSIVMHFSNVKY
jgi:alpha-galactosidase